MTPDTSWGFSLFLPQAVIPTRNAREAEVVCTLDWAFPQQMLYGDTSLLFIYLPPEFLRSLLNISLTSSSLKCLDFLLLKVGGPSRGERIKPFVDVSILH